VIDQLDREILRSLQKDGRMSHRELGKVVGLSPNATGARVQRLVNRGVITGFRAVVDHARLGRSMEATVDVWLNDDRDRAPLIAFVAEDDRVIECFHLTGPLDFRLRAQVASADDLNALLNRLRDEAGVRQTDSRLVLEHIPT